MTSVTFFSRPRRRFRPVWQLFLPPGGAAARSVADAFCAASLAAGTRHHLRVLSGERGKASVLEGGDDTGVPRVALGGGAGDVAGGGGRGEGGGAARRLTAPRPPRDPL